MRSFLLTAVPIKGLYGIEHDVYLSIPAVLGKSGVRDIIPVTLDAAEESKLRESANAINAVQASLPMGQDATA